MSSTLQKNFPLFWAVRKSISFRGSFTYHPLLSLLLLPHSQFFLRIIGSPFWEMPFQKEKLVDIACSWFHLVGFAFRIWLYTNNMTGRNMNNDSTSKTRENNRPLFLESYWFTRYWSENMLRRSRHLENSARSRFPLSNSEFYLSYGCGES